MDIPGNVKADTMAKLGQLLSKTKELFIFFDIINNRIALQILKKWKKQWKHIFFKNSTYFTFNMLLGQRNIKTLLKMTKNKLRFFTIMQLKSEHEYFEFFNTNYRIGHEILELNTIYILNIMNKKH